MRGMKYVEHSKRKKKSTKYIKRIRPKYKLIKKSNERKDRRRRILSQGGVADARPPSTLAGRRRGPPAPPARPAAPSGVSGSRTAPEPRKIAPPLIPLAQEPISGPWILMQDKCAFTSSGKKETSLTGGQGIPDVSEFSIRLSAGLILPET